MHEPPRNLFETFARNAARNAERPALLLDGAETTFGELARLVEAAARWIADTGVGRGDVVGLQLPKRRETYALVIACLRQGCPYVLMDPRNPPPRNASILARLRPKLLVASTDLVNPDGSTLRLADAAAGEAWLAALPGSAPPPPAPIHGLDPAYIMFTSGSTGEPKGAVIPHQGVMSLMRWARTRIADPEQSRFSNLNPLHFDNAVFDVYGGLLNGATLVPVETTLLPNPAGWVRRLREGKANVIFAVPTLFQTLDRLHLLKPESLPDARVIMFGGEGFPSGHLADIYARFRHQTRFVNVYGPTETSCICSSLEIDDAALAESAGGLPSLGRMHDDFDHVVLDEDGRPVEGQQAGELWIGGANVGLGYYANPEETGRRFLQDPRQGKFRSIFYRTGDLVWQDAQQRLWFAGRADNQIKIRGHRIELEEVDGAIERLAGVKRAVAVAVPGPDGPEIAAAIEAERAITADEARAHCAALLPAYMQPARVLQLASLPQNANGKVDRRSVARLFEDGR